MLAPIALAARPGGHRADPVALASHHDVRLVAVAFARDRQPEQQVARIAPHNIRAIVGPAGDRDQQEHSQDAEWVEHGGLVRGWWSVVSCQLSVVSGGETKRDRLNRVRHEDRSGHCSTGEAVLEYTMRGTFYGEAAAVFLERLVHEHRRSCRIRPADEPCFGDQQWTGQPINSGGNCICASHAGIR
jgi:hypothetical protein